MYVVLAFQMLKWLNLMKDIKKCLTVWYNQTVATFNVKSADEMLDHGKGGS